MAVNRYQLRRKDLCLGNLPQALAQAGRTPMQNFREGPKTMLSDGDAIDQALFTLSFKSRFRTNWIDRAQDSRYRPTRKATALAHPACRRAPAFAWRATG